MKKKTAVSNKNRRDSKTTKNSFECERCNLVFRNRKGLIEHRKYHSIDQDAAYKYDPVSELYTCYICSAEFQNTTEAEAHIQKNHEETFHCQQCQKKFSNAYYFCCHVQGHDPKRAFTCPLCPYSTPRRTCIMTHINRMHFHKFYYYCKTCGKGFNDSVFFNEHENEHLGVKPFVCVVCDKTFAFSRYLLFHQTRYHTVSIEGQLQKNQCGICLRTFSKSQTLEKHIESKHEHKGQAKEKKHLCDVCGKSFGTTDKMRIHQRIHTGIKPYVCKFCDKSFIKRDYLIMHERVHTGEKPYSCEYCGRCFNQAAPLRIHLRGHTGERPYICQFCNNGFVSRGSLTMHQKTCRGNGF